MIFFAAERHEKNAKITVQESQKDSSIQENNTGPIFAFFVPFCG